MKETIAEYPAPEHYIVEFLANPEHPLREWKSIDKAYGYEGKAKEIAKAVALRDFVRTRVVKVTP